MKKKNILITGGCGFLGQYLVNELIQKFPDYSIKILDLKSNPFCVIDPSKNKNVEIVLGKDICDYESIKPEFKDIDVVIHLAGIVSFSLKDKQLLKKVNVDGTKNIVTACNENDVSNLIHISSVAALGYNDDEHHPINESFKFNWRLALKKKKYYMLTKHLADVELNKSQCNTLVLYPGLMFGPGDVTNSAKLINAIKKRKIPFNMPGGTNIIDVRDVAKGIVKSLKSNIHSGHYLLSGNNLKFTDVNSIISNVVSVKPPRMTLPKLLNPVLFRILLLAERMAGKKLPVTADNLDSACKFRYFCNDKAKNTFEWQPSIDFKQTIMDTVSWMKENDLIEK